MKLFRIAAFTSDLPDDQIEDEAGEEIIQFGGQGVSRAIAEILRGAGYHVQEPIHLEHLGWEFNVSAEYTLNLRLTDIWKVFTLQTSKTPFLALRPGVQRFQAKALRAATDGLRRDGRFHDLLWFEEFGAKFGFSDPVIDAPGSEKRTAPTTPDWKSWS